VQKASAGLALSLEASTGFRRIGRADRATGRSSLPGENSFIEGSNGWPAWSMKWKPPHDFCTEGPAPGPGIRPKATFRWRPFQSALSGSLFFIPPALPEFMIFSACLSPLARGTEFR